MPREWREGGGGAPQPSSRWRQGMDVVLIPMVVGELLQWQGFVGIIQILGARVVTGGGGWQWFCSGLGSRPRTMLLVGVDGDDDDEAVGFVLSQSEIQVWIKVVNNNCDFIKIHAKNLRSFHGIDNFYPPDLFMLRRINEFQLPLVASPVTNTASSSSSRPLTPATTTPKGPRPAHHR